jgi:hypothetical protein
LSRSKRRHQVAARLLSPRQSVNDRTQALSTGSWLVRAGATPTSERTPEECGRSAAQPPVDITHPGSYAAIVAFRCVMATHRKIAAPRRGMRPLSLHHCRRIPISVRAAGRSGERRFAQTPMRRIFTRRGVDKPTEGGLYTASQVRRRLRREVAPSKLLTDTGEQASDEASDAGSFDGFSGAPGMGSAIPGCLTGESEERETWTAESLRAASSGGD